MEIRAAGKKKCFSSLWNKVSELLFAIAERCTRIFEAGSVHDAGKNSDSLQSSNGNICQRLSVSSCKKSNHWYDLTADSWTWKLDSCSWSSLSPSLWCWALGSPWPHPSPRSHPRPSCLSWPRKWGLLTSTPISSVEWRPPSSTPSTPCCSADLNNNSNHQCHHQQLYPPQWTEIPLIFIQTSTLISSIWIMTSSR